MPSWLNSLKVKIMALLMIAAMVPCVAVGVVCFERSRYALKQAEFARLGILWTLKSRELIAWFDRMLTMLTVVAESNRFRVGFEQLIEGDPSPELHAGAMKGLEEIVRRYVDRKTPDLGLEEFFLSEAKTGAILRVARPHSDKESEKTTDDTVDADVQRVLKQVMSLNKSVVSVSEAASGPNHGSIVIGVPVFRVGSRVCLGVLGIRTGLKEVNSILNLEGTMAETGSACLVDQDFLVRSVSCLNRESVPPGTMQEIEVVKQAFDGKSGALFTSSTGKNLFVAAKVGMNEQEDYVADFDWVLVLEADERKVMGSAWSLAWWALGIAGLTGLVVSIAGHLLSNRVSVPVVALANAAREVSRGNLTASFDVSGRQDEIGTLVEAFGIMIDDMRDQIGRIRETTEVLDTSASEISASISRVAESTNQTSAAVTQVTTTVRQVKQAAQFAVDQAGRVARSSLHAVRITEDTRLNAEDRIQRIHLIKEQMVSIGEIVVRLSDQSRSVEEIIATVQDLADQSNLLAVNASIEAARAGDRGKGFSVVAQEIKLLADQSKQATEQVRAILEDSRKLVSSVVMATEQGNKTVQAGVDQSAGAAESIDRLAVGVTESAAAANSIEDTINRQFAAVDQVFTAMTSIEDAMRKMSDGAEHADRSVHRLATVGSNLRNMMERYKV